MSTQLERTLASKRAFRRELAARPVAEKIRLLEQLSERARVIRRAAALHQSGKTAQPLAERQTNQIE
jgi:hypothetical protein